MVNIYNDDAFVYSLIQKTHELMNNYKILSKEGKTLNQKEFKILNLYLIIYEDGIDKIYDKIMKQIYISNEERTKKAKFLSFLYNSEIYYYYLRSLLTYDEKKVLDVVRYSEDLTFLSNFANNYENDDDFIAKFTLSEINERKYNLLKNRR